MFIRVVTPVIPTGLTSLEDFAGILAPEDTVDFVELDHGPVSVESAFDEVLAAPDVVAKIIEAEGEGADAVVIDCMEDPGLCAARECVSIPVLGPCQTAMNLACNLGHRFSMISVSQSMGQHFAMRARVYGAADNYGSTRSVDMPVHALSEEPDRLRQALLDAAYLAVTKDGSDVIVIGCTGMLGVADQLRDDLLAREISVPVIDPIPVTLRMAKLLVECGLSHPKRSYPTPQTSRIGGFEGSSLHDFVARRTRG